MAMAKLGVGYGAIAVPTIGIVCPKEETQTGRSGTARLWMYEMYSKAIEEDHKKRDIPEVAWGETLETRENPDGSVSVLEPKKKTTSSRSRRERRSSTPASRRVPQYFNTRQDITPQLMDVARANAQMLEQLVQGTIYPSKKTVVKSSSRSSREEEEIILLLVA
jgi:hypothetical protein